MHDIKPHVKVVQHPNPHIRSFHLTREVNESGVMWGFGAGNHFGSFTKKKPGDLAKIIIDRLLAIPGVENGYFKGPYEISVTIGDAFDWPDIGPTVLGEIVNAVFPETLGNEIAVSVELGWSYYVRARLYDDEDNGYRVRYFDCIHRQMVPVTDPQRIDIEKLLDREALQEAKGKVEAEKVVE